MAPHHRRWGRAGRVHVQRAQLRAAIPHESVVLWHRRARRSLLKGTEADEARNVGEIGDLQPGQAETLSLPLEPGHYALICNLPGHYKAGQHADFTLSAEVAAARWCRPPATL